MANSQQFFGASGDGSSSFSNLLWQFFFLEGSAPALLKKFRHQTVTPRTPHTIFGSPEGLPSQTNLSAFSLTHTLALTLAKANGMNSQRRSKDKPCYGLQSVVDDEVKVASGLVPDGS